jgi:uncharacterized protein YcaQ
MKAALPATSTVTLEPDEARAFLVAHHGLSRVTLPRGKRGVRALLARLQCIQLDPLDPMGTNADLVALARVDGIARGDVYSALFPGHAFEHFAKERCILPASAFPFYRDELVEARWWRTQMREERLPPGVLEKVLHEVRARGPVSAEDLADHGQVERLDWSGWKGTPRATSMALEVLWSRCAVVVCGRRRGAKLYDVPERALPEVASAPRVGHGEATEFPRWALLVRVEAAGLLSRAGGATWSMLEPARRSPLPDALVAEGLLEHVVIAGSSRPYLAPAGFRDRPRPRLDDRMRILGPLDPMIWDRALVRTAFDFDYVWEVYKPAAQRRWGWYVCPLLHRGRLVGRLEGTVEKDALRIARIWREANAPLDDEALDAALDRHARACRVSRVVRPRRVLLS